MNPGRTVALAEGVVVDAERQVAYVAAARRIDAVDLKGGELLWTAAVEARPLLVVGDLLLAQAESAGPGRLDVVSFDVRDGRRGALAATVDLPEDVEARLFDGPRSSFRVQAGLAGGEVVLTWRATKVGGDVMQGYLPGPEEGAVPGAKAFERLEPSLPTPQGALQGAAALDPASGAVRPLARAVEAPRPLDALPAAQAKGLAGRLFTSADGRHLLASARSAGGGPNEGGPLKGYRWTIRDRATGERLGELDHATSSAPFVVAGGRLVFVSQPYFERRGDDVVDVPRMLRAVDLASGAELWAKEASDPTFFGPFPP